MRAVLEHTQLAPIHRPQTYHTICNCLGFGKTRSSRPLCKQRHLVALSCVLCCMRVKQPPTYHWALAFYYCWHRTNWGWNSATEKQVIVLHWRGMSKHRPSVLQNFGLCVWKGRNLFRVIFSVGRKKGRKIGTRKVCQRTTFTRCYTSRENNTYKNISVVEQKD